MTVLAVLATAAALAVAAVLVAAAVAKWRDRGATADDFASLGLPAPGRLAVAVPGVELIAAVLLATLPGWGGPLAFALLAAFTAVLASVVRSGRVATCACFGGSSHEPVSGRHLIRNGALMASAALATTREGWLWQLPS